MTAVLMVAFVMGSILLKFIGGGSICDVGSGGGETLGFSGNFFYQPLPPLTPPTLPPPPPSPQPSAPPSPHIIHFKKREICKTILKTLIQHGA